MISYKSLFYPLENKLLYRNLKLDTPSVKYITPYNSARKIAIQIIKTIGGIIEQPCILDATAGCGGDTITFAKDIPGATIVAYENNKLRYEYLCSNIAVYNLQSVITPIFKDSIGELTTTAEGAGKFHVIYIDPPWGGSSYKKIDNLKLTFGNVPLEELVKITFATKNPLCVVLKLPINYDIVHLTAHLTPAHNVHCILLHKMQIVIIKRVPQLNTLS